MKQVISEELKIADLKLKLVTEKFSMASINPTNAKTYEEVMNSDYFTYKKPDFLISDMKKKLGDLHIRKKDYLSSQIRLKRNELVTKLDMLENIASDEFTNLSAKLHPYPSKKNLNSAIKILELKPVTSSRDILSGEEVKTYFEKVLRHLKLDYKIEISDMVTKARVLATQSKLELRSDTKFSDSYVNRLLIHEIGTHIFRSEGGKLQPLHIFSSGFADYIEDEEGLAVYNELKYGVLDINILRNYAGRVVAIDHAKCNDFTSTYNYMKNFFDDKESFNLTLRAKRGIKSKDCVGGYTKDSVYFTGFIKLLKKINEEKYKDMYKGKFNLEHLKQLRGLALEKNPFKPLMLSDLLKKTKTLGLLSENDVRTYLNLKTK